MKKAERLKLHPLEFSVMESLAKVYTRHTELEQGTLNLIVMASGGHDSSALLWNLHRVSHAIKGSLRDKWEDRFDFLSPHVRIFALHCNHKTRGSENDQEQRLVTDQCLRWGVPLLTVCKEDWDPRVNFQEQARQWRYDQARKWAVNLGGSYLICTGHHARDVVETMLLQICRGTGVKGLLSLPKIDHEQHLFRPFVQTSYDELKAYSASQSLTWIEDTSNSQHNYARNKLRHNVLPCLSELNPSYEKAFLTLQQNLTKLLKDVVF